MSCSLCGTCRLPRIRTRTLAAASLQTAMSDHKAAHKGMRGAGVPKEYLAKLDKPLTEKACEAMGEGCLVDGKHVQPVHVGSATNDPSQCKLRVVVRDGRNREVRQLIEHSGALGLCFALVRSALASTASLIFHRVCMKKSLFLSCKASALPQRRLLCWSQFALLHCFACVLAASPLLEQDFVAARHQLHCVMDTMCYACVNAQLC